ncbi:halocin C8-like domain-containing protein [Natrinema sp. DC36]|uniref:halocin C8-like domain-containing protein n=1 Tax=Natrinema sp. DC36 TaxID=2878680 RepID=UPI001CF0BC43|nr:halocin C8-like domain-containing protein [Natrinema sp. DC36]
MTEDPNNNRFSRRRLLRNAAAASAASVTLGSMSNTVAAEDDTPDFEIVSRTEISESEARKELSYVLDSSAAKNIDNAMRTESNVEAAGQFGIAFETDDPEINKTDPVIIFSGYQSNRPQQGSAGILFSIVVDTTPDAETSTREPMMAFGRTVEPLTTGQGVSVASNSTGRLEQKTFTADQQGSASVIQQEPIQKPASTTSTDINGGVSAQDWQDALGCGGCTAIVGTLCEGATGSVSRYACLQACAPFLGSVWGYGACGAACFVIVDAINNYGCAVGAGTICAGMGLC